MKLFFFFFSILQINYYGGIKALLTEEETSNPNHFCDVVKNSFSLIPTDMTYYEASIFDERQNSNTYQPMWYYLLVNDIFGTTKDNKLEINQNSMNLDNFFKDSESLELISESFLFLKNNHNIIFKNYSTKRPLKNKFKSFESFGDFETAEQRHNFISYITETILALKQIFINNYYPNYLFDMNDTKDFHFKVYYFKEFLRTSSDHRTSVILPYVDFRNQTKAFKIK